MQFTCGFGEPFGVWVGKGNQGGGRSLSVKETAWQGVHVQKHFCFPLVPQQKHMLSLDKARYKLLFSSLAEMAELLGYAERKSCAIFLKFIKESRYFI